VDAPNCSLRASPGGQARHFEGVTTTYTDGGFQPWAANNFHPPVCFAWRWENHERNMQGCVEVTLPAAAGG
jgi:hypothetical protein